MNSGIVYASVQKNGVNHEWFSIAKPRQASELTTYSRIWLSHAVLEAKGTSAHHGFDWV